MLLLILIWGLNNDPYPDNVLVPDPDPDQGSCLKLLILILIQILIVCQDLGLDMGS